MADGIVRYILSLTDRTGAGARSAIGNTKSISSAFSVASSAALGLTAAIGTMTAAVGGVAALSAEVADLRNDISDAATRSGIAAETLQGLRVAAEGSGLSFSSLTSGLDQFGARIDQASRGGNTTARAFERLGVEVKDAGGNLRSADSILKDTLGSLNAMEPNAERSALAVQALGRSGGRLLQALSGSELDDFVDLARTFGVDVGPEAARSAGEWQRAIAELDLVVRGLKGAFVDTFGIGADEVFLFTEALVVSGTTLKVYAERAESLTQSVVDSIGGMFDVLGTQFDRASARIEAVGIILGSVAAATGDFLAEVGSKIAAGDLLGAASAAQNVGQAIGDGLAEGLELASDRIDSADESFRQAAIARDKQFAATAQAFVDAEQAADLAAGKALLTLRTARESILNGGEQGNGSNGGENGQTPSAAAFVKPGQTLDDVAAELDRALAEALRAQGGLDEVGRVILSSLDDIGTEARALITEQAAQTGFGLSRSFLSGNLGGGLSQVGDLVGGAGGARLGTAGAVVGGLQFIGEQGAEGIEETLEGVKDALVGSLEALPELIGDVLPRFAVSLVAELIPALIQAAPDLFRALLVELPEAIGDAILDALGVGQEQREDISRFGEVVDAVTTVFGGGDTGGGDLGEAFVTIGEVASGREARDTSAGRTAAEATERGRAEYTRTEDRVGLVASQRRAAAQQPATTDNPFGVLDMMFRRQFGPQGRASSPMLRES